jgi:hypothetical protein
MTPRKNTVTKYYHFLKDLADAYKENGPLDDMYVFIKKYKLNTSTVSFMIKLKFIEKINDKYVVLLLKPEPRHSLELLTFINDSRIKSQELKKNELKTKPCDTKINKSKKFKLKVLWGLISIEV